MTEPFETKFNANLQYALEIQPSNVLYNWRAVVVTSRLSDITGCSLFNHNLWSSW